MAEFYGVNSAFFAPLNFMSGLGLGFCSLDSIRYQAL